MKKYVLIIVTFFSIGILTAQHDYEKESNKISISDPYFGKNTIGINLAPLLKFRSPFGFGWWTKNFNLQYRRTQGKFHFRTSLNYFYSGNKDKYSSNTIRTTDTSVHLIFINHNSESVDIRLGLEKKIKKWQKLNVFVGADVIVGISKYHEYYHVRCYPKDPGSIPVYPVPVGSDPYPEYSALNSSGSAWYNDLLLGADLSIGLEMSLTKRLNLTTQLTVIGTAKTFLNSTIFDPENIFLDYEYNPLAQGILIIPSNDINSINIYPRLNVNLSYKFGGIRNKKRNYERCFYF